MKRWLFKLNPKFHWHFHLSHLRRSVVAIKEFNIIYSLAKSLPLMPHGPCLSRLLHHDTKQTISYQIRFNEPVLICPVPETPKLLPDPPPPLHNRVHCGRCDYLRLRPDGYQIAAHQAKLQAYAVVSASSIQHPTRILIKTSSLGEYLPPPKL